MAESRTVSLCVESVCRRASSWNRAEKNIARLYRRVEPFLFFKDPWVVPVNLVLNDTPYSSSLARICSTDYTKTDYSKTKRERLKSPEGGLKSRNFVHYLCGFHATDKFFMSFPNL